jgi:hypothetical protein
MTTDHVIINGPVNAQEIGISCLFCGQNVPSIAELCIHTVQNHSNNVCGKP